MNLRSFSGHVVLVAAAAFVGVRLWRLLLFTHHYLQDAVLGIYEPSWFWYGAVDTLSAFYLAVAIRSFLRWQRPWRTACGSASAWLLFSLAYFYTAQGGWLLWMTLLVVFVHFSALVGLLIFDLHRPTGSHRIR